MGNQQISFDKQDLIYIPEMAGYYTDSLGNLFSTMRNKTPKQLKPHKHFGRSKNPYMRVRMHSKLYLVHRVLASVHIGRQLIKSEVVNHINGDTMCNKLDNLEVVSQHENVKHAVANKLYCSGAAWYAARGISKSEEISTTIPKGSTP